MTESSFSRHFIRGSFAFIFSIHIWLVLPSLFLKRSIPSNHLLSTIRRFVGSACTAPTEGHPPSYLQHWSTSLFDKSMVLVSIQGTRLHITVSQTSIYNRIEVVTVVCNVRCWVYLFLPFSEIEERFLLFTNIVKLEILFLFARYKNEFPNLSANFIYFYWLIVKLHRLFWVVFISKGQLLLHLKRNYCHIEKVHPSLQTKIYSLCLCIYSILSH